MSQQTRLMKNVLGASTTLDDTFLDSMRELVDPPADQVAVAMCEGGAYKVFADLVKEHEVWEDDASPSRRLPEEVRTYLTLSSTLPSWIKPAKVKQAEDSFCSTAFRRPRSSRAPACPSATSCGTAPKCWPSRSSSSSIRPRRIRETAQMIMNVMCPGGLVAAGRVGIGVHSTQKVRVMHAVIRYMVEHDSSTAANPTEPELRKKFGRPINQEDLAFTLLTFSYVAVRSFVKLGVRMTDADKNNYVHCWNVVGFLMGIREELLPADYAESQKLYEAIREHQAGASKAGQALTAALMNLLEQLMPDGTRHLPVSLTRYLVGTETAAMLGLRQPPYRDRVQFWCMLRMWQAVVGIAGRFHKDRPVPVRLRTAAPAAHEPLGKVARTRAFQDSSRVHRPLVPWRYGRRHSAERRQPMIGVRCSGCRPLFSMWRLIPFTRIAATVLATLSVVATPLAGAQAAQSGSAIARYRA